MVERINITIPDQLRDRLNAVKNSINVSSICKAAIKQAVLIEETKMNAASKRDGSIARLRLQRKQATDEWFQTGKTMGLQEAPDLDLDDFLAVEPYGDLVAWEDLLAARFEWVRERSEPYEVPQVMEESFYSGFFSGIQEYWETIKEEVMDESLIDKEELNAKLQEFGVQLK